MLRLHDHEGKWTKEYDSAILSKVKFNEEEQCRYKPRIYFKTFSSISSMLSHHDLDMTTLKEKWDNSRTDYYIL